MNDIKTKAREYAEQPANAKTWGIHKRALTDAFLAGAAYALSNQWHDAEKEKPEKYETVLVIASIGKYPSFGQWCGCCWKIECNNAIIQSDDKNYPFKVYAWLPIPEYKTKGE